MDDRLLEAHKFFAKDLRNRIHDGEKVACISRKSVLRVVLLQTLTQCQRRMPGNELDEIPRAFREIGLGVESNLDANWCGQIG
jgi:hypothetical protein